MFSCTSHKILGSIAFSGSYFTMNFVFDSANSIFNYFRVGSAVDFPDHCLYYAVADGNRSGSDLQGEMIPITGSREQSENVLRVCIISDTHERHHLLNVPSCDLLVYAGDIFMRGRFMSTPKATHELQSLNKWFGAQPARHKVIIGGNHDRVLELLGVQKVQELFTNATYLCNSSVELMGLRVFGTPLSNGSSGNSAFQSSEFLQATNDCAQALADSASPVDILVTHGTCGTVAEVVQPRLLHIHGHIHGLHGVRRRGSRRSGRSWYQAAAPIMDRHYCPSQLPILLDISRPGVTTEPAEVS